MQFLLNWSCFFEHGQSIKKYVLPLTTVLLKCAKVVRHAKHYRQRMVKSCFWALKTHRRNQLTHLFSKVQVHNFCFPFTILWLHWFGFSIQLVLINENHPIVSECELTSRRSSGLAVNVNHVHLNKLSELNSLTLKIWSSILPSGYYTFPCKLIMRIRFQSR